MQRNSKKRQRILECLQGTTTHPSADWIYAQLKPAYPDLSLATVYRNLHQLREEGIIESVGFIQGQERFDGNVTPHTHVVCVRCGKIGDLPALTLPDFWVTRAEQETDYRLLPTDLMINGICRSCDQKENTAWTQKQCKN